MDLPTIDIKGKKYVEVKERVKYFRENYPDHALITVIVELNEKFCVMRADVVSAAGVVATGHAREMNGDSIINKKSYIENCETSAWGRALANMGIGITAGIASGDEMRGTQQKTKPKHPKPSKEESEAIGAIFDSLMDSVDAIAGEDKCLDSDKLTAYLYAIKGCYPTDILTAKDVAKYIIDNKRLAGLCRLKETN